MRQHQTVSSKSDKHTTHMHVELNQELRMKISGDIYVAINRVTYMQLIIHLSVCLDVIVEIVTNHQQVLGSYALTWTKC